MSATHTVGDLEDTGCRRREGMRGEMVGDKVRYCSVSGGRLAYYRRGRGEPLLLVHGITTYSFICRSIVPLLEKQFDVIAVDLLGCGDSDMPLALSTRPLKARSGRKAFLHFARCLDNHNLTSIEEDLKRLNLPVLVIRGEGDLSLPPAIAETLYRDIPGSRLVRIPTAKHFIQEDEPESTTAAILDFLGGTDG